ncbi:alpha/beta hydrolase family protein, partial [Ilumatobacter sp.]|uniref:alpha/beta hydrolase family protein n=1 Tax=Ilumatobacter sp. TaxID=1967498 RepID=UPI003751A746
MNERFESNGLSLACHVAQPTGDARPGPGVILCHGFPIGPLDAQLSGGTFPQLIDRIASGLGCVAMTFNFRGCGDSEGDFSLQGWVDDLRNAISHLERVSEPKGV